jgi:hypothetical protein
MTRFVVGDDRSQSTLFPERLCGLGQFGGATEIRICNTDPEKIPQAAAQSQLLTRSSAYVTAGLIW